MVDQRVAVLLRFCVVLLVLGIVPKTRWRYLLASPEVTKPPLPVAFGRIHLCQALCAVQLRKADERVDISTLHGTPFWMRVNGAVLGCGNDERN